MEALLGKASSRFLFVTLLPNTFLAVFVGALLSAGAPTQTPKLSAAVHIFATLTWRDFAAGLFLIIVAGVALHPIQYPLIQLLEGYWLTLPGGARAADLATKRYVSLNLRLRDDERKDASTDIDTYRKVSSATARLAWLPDDDLKLLPTSLGNALRAGEERAAARYGMNVAIVFPRLVALIPPEMLERLSDRRNQLDAAANMCASSLLAVVVGLGLLLPTGHWLYVPLCAFIVAWVCYRGAVAAAKGYCTEMAAAVDLHHRDLWRALELPPPPNLQDEREHAVVLNQYLGGEDIDDDLARSIVWQDPPSQSTK